MPRKKQNKTTILQEAIAERDAYRTECNNLRKRLDQMSERYNMFETAGTQLAQLKSFLEKESKRQIFTTHDLQQFVTEIYSKGTDIIGRKNRDYGDHKNSDPFGNFRRHGLKGFLVRIDDKLARLNTFCDNGRLAVMDESVLDTIVDAANYLAIMAAFIYNEQISKE